MARNYYDTLTNHAVAVATTAVLLTSQRPSYQRNAALVQNVGTDVLYVGGAGVTTSNGVKLSAGEHLVIEGNVQIYGISVGTSSARVIEFQ